MEKPAFRKKLMNHVERLPVLPMIVAKMMSLNRKSESYFDDVLQLIESAPSFSARVIAAANSAANAPRMPITTVNNAIARVGSRNAANLVLADGVTQVFVPRTDWEKSLWRHELQVASAARALAQAANDQDLSPDEAYAAGLLHDLGRFVMFQVSPEQLQRIDEADWDSAEKLVLEEMEICGVAHSELGAKVCAQWKVPALLVEVVRHHHRKRELAPQGHLSKLIATVQTADFAMFPSAMPGTPGLEEGGEALIEAELIPRMPKFMKLSSSMLMSIINRTVAEVDALCLMLGVG